MRLILAPMEGVIDHTMRKLLTRIGGLDRCVTEFVRVTDQKVPARVFRRYCPELDNDGLTLSGIPVFVQLLGGNPATMAESASEAVRQGARGIDLNFGCPTKIVNRHDGGSVLLKEPCRVAAVVQSVRDRVDSTVRVTAKIRIGFNDSSRLQELVNGIAEAGADELCIHARTRLNGYKPPAFWHLIGKLEKPTGMTIITNGEIWSASDAINAQKQSGCIDLMLGRGSLAQPDLAPMLQAQYTGIPYSPLGWIEVVELVETMFLDCDSTTPRYVGNRTKQWLAYLKRHYTGAEILFQQIKRLNSRNEIRDAFTRHRFFIENRFRLAS